MIGGGGGGGGGQEWGLVTSQQRIKITIHKSQTLKIDRSQIGFALLSNVEESQTLRKVPAIP